MEIAAGREPCSPTLPSPRRQREGRNTAVVSAFARRRMGGLIAGALRQRR